MWQNVEKCMEFVSTCAHSKQHMAKCMVFAAPLRNKYLSRPHPEAGETSCLARAPAVSDALSPGIADGQPTSLPWLCIRCENMLGSMSPIEPR